MESEDLVKRQLEELQKQLGKKQKFEDAIFSLKSLLQQKYPSASPPLRKSVCMLTSLLFDFAFLLLFYSICIITAITIEFYTPLVFLIRVLKLPWVWSETPDFVFVWVQHRFLYYYVTWEPLLNKIERSN